MTTTRSATSLASIRRELRTLADPAAAALLQRFFKTGPGEYGEGDRFLGIRVPPIRRLSRTHRTLPRPAVLALLRSRWHEERLLALLILVEQYRRGSAADRNEIFATYLAHTGHINSWDLVDVTAEHIVGAHLRPEQAGVFETLARSPIVWERRIAIMATFRWIRLGTFEPTLQLAALLLNDPHDLIHKAVGWMLREVGKRDRAREEAWLRQHHRWMPRVMLRSAIEHLPDARRKAYLPHAR